MARCLGAIGGGVGALYISMMYSHCTRNAAVRGFFVGRIGASSCRVASVCKDLNSVHVNTTVSDCQEYHYKKLIAFDFEQLN